MKGQKGPWQDPRRGDTKPIKGQEWPQQDPRRAGKRGDKTHKGANCHSKTYERAARGMKGRQEGHQGALRGDKRGMKVGQEGRQYP